MPNCTITIEVDAETAQAFSTMSREEQRKIQAQLSLWLRRLGAERHPRIRSGYGRGRAQGQSPGTYPIPRTTNFYRSPSVGEQHTSQLATWTLLTLDPFRGVRILTPQAFLELP